VRRLLIVLVVLVAIAAGLLAAGRLGFGPMVVTTEGEQKLILLLGSPRDEATEPGITLRIPLAEDVRTYDSRWLHLSSEPEEIQTQDRERIVVDNYLVWRISDPLLFQESFPTGMDEAEAQIDREVRANVRAVIGRRTFEEVLSEARAEIMEEITRRSDEAFDRAGITIPYPQQDMHLHVKDGGGVPAALAGPAHGTGRPEGAPDFRSGDEGAHDEAGAGGRDA